MSIDSKSSYYDYGGLETITVIRKKLGSTAFLNYCHGNALKYLCRCFHKGTLVRDLEKARIYIGLMLDEFDEKPTYSEHKARVYREQVENIANGPKT